MGVQTYSAQQRRAVNLIWAAAGEYGFEPKFLAMKTDVTASLARSAAAVVKA